MNTNLDQLYELLPVVYRQRDAERGWPLKALLRVIAEQVDIVEQDIEQLYENWFIETCEDWLVPYIGDLIGYRPVHEAGEPGDVTTPQGRQRNKILIPRREVANTIRYRRRKGTLALLELLANDVAGWPARAVEFYKLLGWTQALNHLRPTQGRTVDLRQGEALDRLNGPFDELAHTVDVRRIASHRTPGRYNLPDVGLFVWRLKAYSVTQTPAYCLEKVGSYCYTFSVLGNDTPLYTRPEPEPEPTHIAGEMNLPIPIRRRAFEARKTDYYGENKSLQIWKRGSKKTPRQLIPPEKIIVADLKDWQYVPRRGQVAVDPELGRIVFPPGELPKQGLLVSYHYGFSADIGGGEYDRSLSQPAGAIVYQVGEGETLDRINDALTQWKQEKPAHAVIEITDSGVYVEQLNVKFEPMFNLSKQSLESLKNTGVPDIILESLERLIDQKFTEEDTFLNIVEGQIGKEQIECYKTLILQYAKVNQSLQIRAANRKRPVIRLLDWHTDLPDDLTVTDESGGSRFILDGLLITGRGVQIEGDLADVIIRHTTLVPGWTLLSDCEPRRPAEPSLELFVKQSRVTIEHSILGSIQVTHDEVELDPIPLYIRDSILDATGFDCDNPTCEALGAPGRLLAHAILTIVRSTVFGRVQTHAIDLAENSIFMSKITVARRQRGCMRFCYITPGSRTPRRFNCQPDLVKNAVKAQSDRGEITEEERDRAQEREALRVRPRFNSMRYGTPTYCQLAHSCAEEIKRGADDESEMGVYHDLYQPQRTANLRARLDEYTPAGMEADIIFCS